MEKSKKTFLILFLLIILCGYKPLTTAYATEKKTHDIYFFTTLNNNANQFLIQNYNSIINSCTLTSSINSQINLGYPISIRSVENYYYVPIINNNKCIGIITLYQSNSGYSYYYQVGFSNLLNTLTSGQYYFEKDNSSIYLISSNSKYLIESYNKTVSYQCEANYTNQINLIEDEIQLDIFQNILTTGYSNNNNRSVTSNQLNIPYYANGGYYGYCWLCCAASVCSYYGTNINLETAHSFVHGTSHTLHYCQGGYLTDVNQIVTYYTGKVATITNSKRAPSYVMLLINSEKPLVTSWGNYSNITRKGHEMIISGYIYDNYTNIFTYIIRDPNTSNYIYLPFSYNASAITYSISGDIYTWEATLDGWI